MKKLSLLCILTTGLLLGQGNKNTATALAEKALEKLIVEHKAVGAVGGVTQGNDMEWTASHGYMDFKNSKKANTTMLTRIASIAKPMTAIAVMQLYEKKLIQLDDPIQMYINELSNLETQGITIRQLLNHSSGIKAYASKKEFKDSKNYNSLTEAMHVFIDRSLHNTPGKSYHYSTYNYVVLGVLIERVSGERFEDYMKKYIWNKADMKHTGIEKYGKNYTNKTKLYLKNKNGNAKQVKKENNLSNRTPGGGFYSSLDDVLKFGQAVLNNTLIKPETLALMLQNNGLKKDENPYGMGWFMYGSKPNPEVVFGHSGGQTGASSQLLIIPSQQKVIVVLCNTSDVWEHVIGTAAELNSIFKKE